MDEKILVTYASKYGSTKEVAEAVAATLHENGIEADLLSTPQVKSLAGYRAVVLGAPFYIGRLHRNAQRFLLQYKEALMQVPVALFTLGPTISTDFQEAVGQLDEELARMPWLKPLAHEMFGGKYDPKILRFPDTLLAKLPASPLYQLPASDLRDWPAIRAWTVDLILRLRAAFRPE